MYDDFGYEARDFLYDYYEELSDDIGEHFVFDRVGIRCDWGEYANMEEAKEDYPNLDEDEYYVIDNGVVMVPAR